MTNDVRNGATRWMQRSSIVCITIVLAALAVSVAVPQDATPPPAEPPVTVQPLETQPVETPPALPVAPAEAPAVAHGPQRTDYWSLAFVFLLATIIGLGVIMRVSRLLHTPLMSITNAISAIAVVGSILVTGDPHYPPSVRVLGAIALAASMTNIVSGFMITDRMLKMFRQPGDGGKH